MISLLDISKWAVVAILNIYITTMTFNILLPELWGIHQNIDRYKGMYYVSAVQTDVLLMFI